MARRGKKWGKGNPLWEWQHRNSNRSRSKKRGITHMAKRRSRSRRSSKSSFGIAGKLVAAGVYGAGRNKLNQYVSPWSSQLPIGANIADNVGMMIALYGAKKFLGRKVPYLNQVADAGMMIEAAMLGSDLVSGMQ